MSLTLGDDAFLNVHVYMYALYVSRVCKCHLWRHYGGIMAALWHGAALWQHYGSIMPALWQHYGSIMPYGSIMAAL